MKDLTDAICYCINLKRRRDRRRQFEAQEAIRTMPPLHFIDAVVGSSIDIKKDERIGLHTRIQILTKYRRSNYEIDTDGAVGASLSHLKAWKAFLKTDYKYALILEDDAELPVTLSMMIYDCAKYLPEEWDIWLLGWNYNTIDRKSMIETPFKQVLQFFGAQSYILTRKAAKCLIEHAIPVENHIEYYMTNVAFISFFKIIRHQALKINQMDRVLNITDVQTNRGGCPVCIVDDKKEAAVKREENINN